MMTFGRGVRKVEGMVEMNAAPVVSPLNSLDCARINVGPGGREEEVEEEVKKKRVAAGKCQYQARVVAKKGRREEWEKGERKKERKRETRKGKRERERRRE